MTSTSTAWARAAFNAGGLSHWTLERVKMNKNGSAGWDGNVCTGGSNSGAMVMRDIEIAWNGCGERVATGEPGRAGRRPPAATATVSAPSTPAASG